MASLVASTASLPAGGGPYTLGEVTVEVFLTGQPDHRLTIGSDRTRRVPLARHEGWILPAGAEGLCEYDAPLDFATVSVLSALLHDAGLERGASAGPAVGALDPLLVQMAVQAEGFGAGGTLYAETMARALAAQLVQSVRPAEPDVAAIDDARLRRAVEHIRAHLADNLSVDALAGEAAMSAPHFSRTFRAATGASPLQFVIGERLEMELVLLRTTELAVSEVAYRHDPHHEPRHTSRPHPARLRRAARRACARRRAGRRAERPGPRADRDHGRRDRHVRARH